jgi:D-threo-aldose 1-dehydrogenase
MNSRGATQPPQLERRSLASGRVSVSVLGFGAATLGNLYSELTDPEAEAAVQAALESGVTYFDTAPSYGFGLSEARLGRALAGRARAAFTVSTKVGRRIEIDATVREKVNDGFAVSGRRAVFDYSRDGIRRSFEASLRRLNVEYVDILLLHDIGRHTHGDRHEAVLRQALDEALPAMAELRDSGVVGAIGIGVNEQAVCLDVMPRFALDCIMLAGRYTLLEQHDAVEVMREAQRRAVKVIVAGPYNSGLLAAASGPGATYNYEAADSAVREQARKIYAACAVDSIDVGAAALQLPLVHPAVVAVVAGHRTVQEVLTAVRRLHAPIPGSLWKRLRADGLIETSTVVPS